MLKQRLLTVAVIVPLLLLIIFLGNHAVFAVTVSVVSLIAAWEWGSLMKLTALKRLAYTGAVLAIFAVSSFLPIMWIFYLAAIWWLLAIIYIALYPRWVQWWTVSKFTQAIIGMMVIIPSWWAFMYIYITPQGPYLIFLLLLIVSGADSGAYFTGRFCGKHALAPQISPKKTIEGLIGGVITAIIFAAIGLYFMPIVVANIWSFVAVIFITVIMSVLGDLFESMVKRMQGIKDSGKILPGHGGILDRIDSLTAAIPIYLLGLMYLAGRL